MKVPIAYYLVLLYATVMFKPLIPIVRDTLSHTFSEAIHLATIHAIYGTNHLEKELSDSTPDNINSKHQNNINTEDPVPAHVLTNECTFDFCCNGTDRDYFSLNLYKVKPGFIVKNLPPPKFS
jgi:hypothetical protein